MKSRKTKAAASSGTEAVARWMVAELRKRGCLYQEEAVYRIAEKFGDKFTYDNENGNLAIRREVLSTFGRMTAADVVWDRSERAWRWRESSDSAGRQQD